MKKFFLLFVTIVAICFTGCKNATDDTIKIGVILPLSGSLGEEGQKGLAAIKLAEKEINDSPEYSKKIQLIIEDGYFTGKGSLAAYNKLLLKGVSAFVCFGTPPTQAIKERVNDIKLPLLAIDGSSGLAKSSKWIFEFFPPVKEIGQAAGSFSKEKWPSKNMALLTMNISGSDDFALGFTSAVGQSVPRESFEADATDVRSQILKLLQTKPDVIAIRGYNVGYTTAMNQLLESGYQGNIITDANITSITDKLRKGDRDIYFVSQSFGDYTDNPGSRKFINSIKSNYHMNPTLFSAYLYEIIKVITTAVNIEGTTPDDIQRNILGLKNYPTMFGPMNFSEDGDINLPFIVLKMDGDNIVEVGKEMK